MLSLLPVADSMMIALHFMTCTLLLCGILVWIERQDNRKQRTCLAVMWLVAAALMMLRVVLTYKESIPDVYPVLPIRNLYGGFWALLILSFYPVEVVNPGWLKWRILLFLFSPMIAITVILATVPMEFRELHSWIDVLVHIGEPNVWFRLIILFGFIIPYTILLVCVPYNWRRSSVDAKWIRKYVFGVLGIGVLYIFFMLTGSLVASTIHLTYCMLFFCYVTYQELYLRLLPTVAKDTDLPDKKEDTQQTVFPSEKPQAQADPNGLWIRLERYMCDEKPWLSPDITAGDVAKAIGVSRTRLSTEISAQGDDSFHTLVARYRIAEFCKMAQCGEVENMNEALFSVGFRSRSTAYNRFKEQIGMTPAEYVRTLKTRDA